jgi:uncharacterized membrane-anchored protein
MRKRSKYRPRAVLANPLGYVLESIKPVAQHEQYLVELKIKNHLAMTTLTRGEATRGDLDTLIASVNIVEALYRMGFGKEYADVVHNGLEALRSVGKRGAESGRFILKADEMNALNLVMELHDAQMDLITIKDMDKAIELVKEEFRQRKMRPIVEKT